ncbi:hypothetical protein R3W88_016636 [Solanum pinnatisectum]|uniref:RNase H type-1 domain-containing protein n=1 Tax=Solanum pinnatisectum TaxID=50273 RepID=A0AAV9KY40_9SOLN|nr:hypothetical protein R3W88_016636 [Solanum pinnatisectum]
MARLIYTKLRQVPVNWPDMVDFFEKYKPELYYLAVSWRPPEQGMLKCNTDGVSKGNPGRSSYDFCLRNHRGDLIYAQGEEILETTNITAETIANCVTMGLSMISMKTDSLVLVKIFRQCGKSHGKLMQWWKTSSKWPKFARLS